MHFTRIIYLLLFIPLIAYAVWYILRGRKISPSMKVSTTLPFGKDLKTYKNYLIHLPFLLRMVSLSMLILVLMRPVSTRSWSEENVEGIDIMLAMDVSTSMSAVDIEPNRIEVAKEVAAKFVSGRKNDNIGLTLFAGESFTQCPLTIDYASVLSLIDKSGIEYALNGALKDGTAIGMGIANAVSRLKDSKAESKVIILLTDGSNNSGEITPEDAAEIAKEYGVRIYTIGFRTDNEVVQTPYGIMNNSEFDEKTLKSIASVTGGEYYRSSSKESLMNIYKEIDQLERTKLEVKHFGTQEEKFMIFAFIAIVSLMLEILLRNTVLKKIP
ncbi:MAG: VWA domain-containing protein [Bacteroidaceae bacterium]|nr:VWA domain-containing protein [Bacteroidaceae bacterium]